MSGTPAIDDDEAVENGERRLTTTDCFCLSCGYRGPRSTCHCAAPGCHRTFGGVSPFDAHRSTSGEHGSCLDPASVGLVWRDGAWRGAELSEEAKARFRRDPVDLPGDEVVLNLAAPPKT